MKIIAISAVCLSLVAASFGLTGCADPYGPVGYGYVGPGYYGSGYYSSGYYRPNYYASGYYGPRYYRTGYYGSPYYNSGYYPGYASTGYISVAVGDRPYYTHGQGYWAGPRYYTWHHGYWHRNHGHRVWVHGNYVVRG